jgi:hypothetical protein
LKRAQERITRRNPIARTCDSRQRSTSRGEGRGRIVRGEEGPLAQRGRTKESEMMVLRPAAILGNERGTLVVLRGVVLDQAGWIVSLLPLVSSSDQIRFCMRTRTTLLVSHQYRYAVAGGELCRFEMEL